MRNHKNNFQHLIPGITIRIIFFLVFMSMYLQAQEIKDKETFKKCRKEFNKKTCLSDEDNDGILLYLDQCPNQAGPIENHGCPWPDTDKDGVLDKDDQCPEIVGATENNGCPWPDYDNDSTLDKDDACPTIPGLPEYNGCPRPAQQDHTNFYEEQRVKYEQFQEEHQNIREIYNLINKKILNDILSPHKKEMLNPDFGIAFGYVKFTSICGIGYYDSYPIDVRNFLISKFWNKETFEYVLKKYNKEILIRNTIFDESFNTELEKLMGKETFQYLLQYSTGKNGNIIIPSKNKKDPTNFISIYIQFITPYKIEVVAPSNPKIYEYKNGKWKSYNKPNP